jgi:RimJ/RimL family protein N-acetyltransferase
MAATTRSIDLPYSLTSAETWIAGHGQNWCNGSAAVFAIRLLETDELVGAIGLEICEQDHLAELGYWVSQENWGRGIATEACGGIVDFGFRVLGLNRIVAHHMTKNPQSGRVLEKVGFVREGILRKHFRKWGKFEDAVIFGLLATEWNGPPESPGPG